MDTEKSFNLAVNHKYFTSSLLTILDFIENKSQEIIKIYCSSFENGEQSISNYKETNKYKAHLKIQLTCNIIKQGFSKKDNNNYDQGKIIKKIYKTITQNLDKFYPNPDISLFQLRNENNETITIIPGLDIYQVLRDKIITNEDMNKIWGYMYMMYISASEMICEINKKENKIHSLLPDMRKKILQYKIDQDGIMFNPFIGLNQKTGEYDIDAMYAETDDITDPNSDPSAMLKLSGIDKLFDMNKIRDQLKDMDESEIEEVGKNISKMVGAENDNDINELCGDLIKNVVENFQNNKDGNINPFEIAQSVAQNMKGKMNEKKMEKTAKHFNNFMNNSQEQLKDLKDENGNPIGDQLLNTLNLPAMMAKMLSGMQGMGPQK
jgi:hypothetical protein